MQARTNENDFSNEKQCFVIIAVILVRRGTDTGAEFELLLDERNHIAHINYLSDEMRRSVP